VYDRDDEQWPDERTFKAAIARLAGQPQARAVVIRCAATSATRRSTCALVGATHMFVLTAPLDELAHRLVTRGRADTRATLASVKPWFDRHDRDDGIEDFPGWDEVRPEPNVCPRPAADTPRPVASTPRPIRPPGARTPSRTGRPWTRIKARVIKRDGGICHLCGKPGADTADHLVPVSLGGAVYAMSNLAAAHHDPCNRLRGNRPIDVVRAELMGTPATTSTWHW
jgi:5-methylcytosine-specific restriction endonuclease McrA